MRSVLLLAAGLAALASPALAQVDITRASKGYTYFHYRGVDIDVHDQAVQACIEVTSHTAQSDPHAGSNLGLAGAILTPVITGPLVKGQNTNADAANIENCMVVQGWDVVRLDPAEGAALAKLDAPAQRAALTPWVGADQPHGTVVRRFDNDLTRGATTFDGRAGDMDKLSLSIASVGQMPDPARPRVSRSGRYSPDRQAGLAKPITADSAGQLRPDEALIVIRTASTGKPAFYGLHFERTNDAVSEVAYRFEVLQPDTAFWAKKIEELYIFRVPAGRYRIDSITGSSSLNSSLSLCLGSPGFDVAPGEVVFAGNVRFAGDGRFAPTMELDPARRMLSPNDALAERLKPAEWMNGTLALCGPDSYLYALDIPGAPKVTAP